MIRKILLNCQLITANINDSYSNDNINLSRLTNMYFINLELFKVLKLHIVFTYIEQL